jgi:hypothetical protein
MSSVNATTASLKLSHRLSLHKELAGETHRYDYFHGLGERQICDHSLVLANIGLVLPPPSQWLMISTSGSWL